MGLFVLGDGTEIGLLVISVYYSTTISFAPKTETMANWFCRRLGCRNTSHIMDQRRVRLLDMEVTFIIFEFVNLLNRPVPGAHHRTLNTVDFVGNDRVFFIAC